MFLATIKYLKSYFIRLNFYKTKGISISDTAIELIPIKANAEFEEITDVLYNQDLCKLQATIIIRNHTGYNGNICEKGSTEYVRFFVDNGNGYKNVGLSEIQVYDIADYLFKSRLPQKHIIQFYYSPKNITKTTNIKIKAILSWEKMPPCEPDWIPQFGNAVEKNVTLKNSEELIGELLDDIYIPKNLVFSYA